MSSHAAPEGADRTRSNARPTLTLAAISFAVLATVVFTGTRPFHLSDVPEFAVESRGNAFEFLIFLVSTAVCIVTCGVNLRPKRLEVASVGLLLLLAYCGVTLLWSDAWFQGTVRYGQFVLVSLAVLFASYALGPEKIVDIIYRILIALLAVNLLSVAFIDGAVHGASQYDPYQQLFGSWKGVHNHKNLAGAVAALTGLMAFCFILSGRWRHVLVLVPSGIFLLGSNSKTSMALTLFVMILLIVSKGLSAIVGRFLARFLLVFSFALALIVGLIYSDSLLAILEDPYALTGRVEVWNALGRYIEAYPWTGSGFGSFWRLGEESPILQLTDGWGTQTGSGHNGYMDAAVTLGIPGLILTLCVLVALPVASLIQKLEARALHYDIFFCFILFALGHNLLESSILAGNNSVFFFLLIGLFGIRSEPWPLEPR